MPLLLAVIACASPAGDTRAAWMLDVLARDNAPWLARDPALLEAKYRRMAADPYDFMRGTFALFLADMAAPHPDRTHTAFLATSAAASVLLAGDPHPENVATLLPGSWGVRSGVAPEELVLELTDLDGAAFGPWVVDVRRGALGVLAMLPSTCDSDCQRVVIARYARAYATGLSPVAVTCDSLRSVALVWSRCRASASDAATGVDLDSRTTLAGGARRWLLDESLDGEGKGMLALSDEERAQVERLLAAAPPGPAGARVLDVARRYGMGVASLPAVRYAVLWDLGDDGPDDDAAYMMRELVDPPAPPGRLPSVPALFDSNAARAEGAPRRLWSRPDADAWIAGVVDGSSTFKRVGAAGWLQGFEHDEVEDADPEALVSFAEGVARVLAGAHARGVTAAGDPAGDVIRAELEGRGEDLVEELLVQGPADLARLQDDHAVFVEALEAWGPLLGATAPPTETPR
jgi:uncharacterized protein (DUF2252 family)